MEGLTYVKPEKISIKGHPILNELWVQDRIAEDPALLGLGDLILKDKERIQPRAGRLDLLLQDPESSQRYEVEIQLGKTDESHIIRTIEYWDIERRRYPQYDHIAVIVAEEITSRFLNVISLFNGFIPLIAIQMSALKIDDQISLIFTTVLSEARIGEIDEGEEERDVVDREYWEKRGSKSTVSIADDLLLMIRKLDAKFSLKYNKFYIGLAKEGQPNNFVTFRPRKEWLLLMPRLEKSDEYESKMESKGLDLMDYDKRWGRYRIRLTKNDIVKHNDFLVELLTKAYESSN
jgi:hypothetical protein